MFKDLKQFLLRGNVVDLAVAVVVGTAFGTVVTALVKDLITPLIAVIIGTPNFSALGFTLRHVHFPIGDFVDAVFSFLTVAVAVFYLVVVPTQALTRRLSRPAPAVAPQTKACPECCSQVPVAAKRCMYCTSRLN